MVWNFVWGSQAVLEKDLHFMIERSANMALYAGGSVKRFNAANVFIPTAGRIGDD